MDYPVKAQRGFTLVEVLAAGIISSLLAAVLLTILYLASAHVKQLIPRQRVMTAYNVVSEQIHRMTRQACFVRAFGEAHAIPLPALGASVSFQDGLVFYDRSYNIIGGYYFSASGGHHLREWNTATNAWQAFKIAGDSLPVTPGNKFGHSADRKTVTFEIHLKYFIDGAWSLYKTPTETAQLKGN